MARENFRLWCRSRAWVRTVASYCFMGMLLLLSGVANAAPKQAPSEIKLGTLYAGTGSMAWTSLPVYMGLKLWIDNENAKGGVMVKPYGKRIPIKLISYDDQSNTATAATLYNQLITQDKVDLLVADAGSVLTSVAVPIAHNHKMLLWNSTGTGGMFFTPDNPYIVLTSMPVSTVWPRSMADFLTQEGPKLGIKRIAMIYATNDFSGAQAKAVRKFIQDAHAPVEIVYDKAVPSNTSNYAVLLNSIRAAQPDAVIELGYPPNDTAFLRNLHDSGIHFKWVFATFLGYVTENMLKTVGVDGMKYIYTYTPIRFPAESGMSLPEFRKAWDKKYPDTKVAFDLNAISGYTAGVVIENALAATRSLDQLDLRKAVFSLSGKLKTMEGTFELDENGAQIGQSGVTPLGQMLPDGKGGLTFKVVYPLDVATGRPLYPAPAK